MSNKISDIIGKTVVNVVQTEDKILMIFSDGDVGKFYHESEYGESVHINDVSGDWSDLIGNPLLEADEQINDRVKVIDPGGYNDGGIGIQTFYTFRGIGGSVNVKWYGETSGRYPVLVDVTLTKASDIKRVIESLDS
jgi:hypothetical protein